MPVEIRPGTPADAGFFAEAWQRMLGELELAPGGLVDGWRERLAEHFAAGIADGSQGWFVALRGGERIGSAGTFLRRSLVSDIQRRRIAVLAGVYVLPAHRRGGIGRRLVVCAIDWARERGCTHVTLRASAAAEPLYRELGFEDDAGLILKLG
jgi:GNAT superfamily N-acetyltransferase